jgi:hypothetical protein
MKRFIRAFAERAFAEKAFAEKERRDRGRSRHLLSIVRSARAGG